MDADQIIDEIALQIKQVPGVKGAVLGGSRARGTHTPKTPKSDIDIGIYYDSEKVFNIKALDRIAAGLDDLRREGLITNIGEWGDWINGGGWLTVKDFAVDFLFRDINKVAGVINNCLSGEVTINYYPGHPHGFVNAGIKNQNLTLSRFLKAGCDS